MRDFTITVEPDGKSAKSGKAQGQRLPFVIQKHAASHLHYDFRLGWNGVLKSWACAKGPSYNPADRRLAVEVEDHPMEYGGFEGTIPAGQYGGGTVMLWDQGQWEPQPGHEDVDAGLRDGTLKFTLHGTKMRGNWTLVRMGGKAAREKKPNWLLIKEHDRFEATTLDKPVTDTAPDSVVTHRSLDEIAASNDHVWNSRDTATDHAWHRVRSASTRQSKFAPNNDAPLPIGTLEVLERKDAPREQLPQFVSPQLATAATSPPSKPGWINELKMDGYRIQCRLDDGKVQLLTRTGLDWTRRMKTIANEAAHLPAKSALLDGEVVILGEDGNSSFANLQAAFQEKDAGKQSALTYFVFDLLHLDGHNLRGLPLVRRKALLLELLKNSTATLQISEHLDSDATITFRKACELGAEGIVSKRAESPYVTGRSSSWVKLKCLHEQEFVVGGFTLPGKGKTGTKGIGSLLLGYYDGRHDKSPRLIYAGRTGTGFTEESHRQIRKELDSMKAPTSLFDTLPAEAAGGAVWVAPQLVAQVRFANWTADGLLRHAAFKGLRRDKVATEVRREEVTHLPGPASKNSGIKEPKVERPTAVSTRKQPSKFPSAIRLTHPEKILDSESQLTKQQLAEYYWAIAPYMLPHISGRPLSLVRCPEGSTQPCFFQKHTNRTLAPGIGTISVPDKKTGRLEPYITISTAEALASLAQMSVLEVHPWSSRNDNLEHADLIIFDLDPDAAVPWRTLANAAAEVRIQLKQLGLECFLKSTGGKGLHVVVPIDPEHGWNTIKRFSHAFVVEMERQNPKLYVTKMTKAARVGRIYLDYLRNERGATAVAAFSPRARVGAPVSLPLRWSDIGLASRPIFHVSDYSVWKSQLARDPWKRLRATKQGLTWDILRRYEIGSETVSALREGRPPT